MTQPPQPGARKYPPPTTPPPTTPPPATPPPTTPPPYQPYPSAPPPAPYGYPQPGYQVRASKPPAYWPLSIVAVLGSLVFGVIAMVYSAQVNSRWSSGDVAGAQKASKAALIFGIIGVVVGIIVIISFASSGSSST